MTTTVNDVTNVGKRAPWRILIKAMGANRGPGTTLATICDAKSVGAMTVYNSAGEAHFTLPNDHPDIDVILPRKVHYVIEQHIGGTGTDLIGGAWVEKFAGLVIDKSDTDYETVFTGIDYLGLFGVILDERFDNDHPDEPPPTGSKYVDQFIGDVVADQLQRAVSLIDSPVGFISVGTIDQMTEKVTIWSTMKTTLEFCIGLIDSHKQGTGKRTRMSVRKIAGVYTVIVEDSPGADLPNLRLGYGELVQGYENIPFGPDWVSLVHGIGRTREGLKVLYDTEAPTGISTSEWGRFAKANLFLDLADLNDLKRRTKQMALDSGQIGQKMALAYRMNALRPLDGYDITDNITIEIIHGATDTRDYADYWTILAVTWEGFEDGHTELTLTIVPKPSVVPANPNDATSVPYKPGGALGNPDGTFRDPLVGDHVHAIGEPMVGDGSTTVFYPANEYEPYTLAAFLNGARVDITEGPQYDMITFSVAPAASALIRLDYLARLV